MDPGRLDPGRAKGRVAMADSRTIDRPAEERGQWESSLDQLTKEHEGEDITIEVLDRTYGDLEEVSRLPFTSAMYDRPTDTVIIAVGGRSSAWPVVLRHMIPKPDKLVVDDRPENPALMVVDSDGTATLVSFLGKAEGTS
ncbi:MAG TPA: DUF5335 family protein [Kribbella sp.]